MWQNLKQLIWEWRGVSLSTPTAAGIAIALRCTGLLQGWEWAVLDQFFRWRPLEPPDSRIVIVGINEMDLQKVGTWPIPDAVLAKLLQKIRQQQPKAIGLDLFRNLPVAPGHQDLVKIWESTPNLIGIEKAIADPNSSAIAPPPILKHQNQVGINDAILDADGKLRRGLLKLKSPQGEIVSNLSLRLASIYLKAKGITPVEVPNSGEYKSQIPLLQLNGVILPRFHSHDGPYVNADAGGYQILLNYRGPAQSFSIVSLTDVLENRIPPDRFRDRIVLIGSTATSLRDFFPTPYSITTTENTSGVEIQANLTSQIIGIALDGRAPIRVWDDSLEALWIILWSYLGATLSWRVRRFRWIVLSSCLTVGSLWFGTYLLFIFSWWIPVVPATLALIGSTLAIKSYIAHLDFQDHQAVMNLFGRHVTPQIAAAIWRDRDQIFSQGCLLGRKMTATVLFSDLKGFSSIAETLEPEILMSWLNDYMGAMAQLVMDRGGVVDKFIGDAVMAVFGVPIPRTTPEEIAQDAIAAVSCAVAMASALDSLNHQWQTQGRPSARMRVGIATGTVVTGSLGSSQRLDYTTIGDSVNVASRLESYDKSIHNGICRILINEETYRHIQGRFPTKSLGNISSRGREHSVGVYQVLLH